MSKVPSLFCRLYAQVYHVPDITQAVGFWHRGHGAEPMEGPSTTAGFLLQLPDQSRIFLWPLADGSEPHTSPWWEVDDIEAAHGQLRNWGCQKISAIDETCPWGPGFLATDCSGIRHEFIAPFDQFRSDRLQMVEGSKTG